MSNDYDPNYKPKKDYFLVGGKAVISDRDGKILVLKRSSKAGGGGKWSLTGGALEYGEDAYTSLRREIAEETGLNIAKLKAFAVKTHQKSKDPAIIIGYKSQTDITDIKLNWEHDDYKWLKPQEALNLDLTDDGHYFIERYFKQLSSRLKT